MADDPRDIEAAILEADVFEFNHPDGTTVRLTVTLLDIQNDAVPMSREARDHGAQAFGMLFFESASVTCPKEAVVWERFDDGLQIAPTDDEAHLLDETVLKAMCLRALATFLAQTAEKDPKYAWLAPPRLH